MIPSVRVSTPRSLPARNFSNKLKKEWGKKEEEEKDFDFLFEQFFKADLNMWGGVEIELGARTQDSKSIII